jgi:hypothetical protein
MDISERFEMFDDEYLEFDRVENKRSNRPDLHAFLLLDELFPGDSDIVDHAEHDEIWLDVDDEQLKKLTDDQILELVRCGIRYDSDNASLCTFV